MTTNPQNDSLVKLLVRLTLNRGEREKLQAIVDDLKDKGNSDEAKKELARSGIDPDGVLSIAHFYCDRLCAGVDEWTPSEQDKWIDACQIVTELTSSTVQSR